jgi:hypothetical protein
MENVDFTQAAFVFWMGPPRLHGEVTRFDRLDDAVRSVMQHASARTDPVAWIKTMDRHLDMDQIRGIARHSGLVSYLSRTEDRNTSAKDVCTKPRSLMKRLAQSLDRTGTSASVKLEPADI